jgi:hypothetical protein
LLELILKKEGLAFFNQHKVVILQVVTGLGIFDIDDDTKYVLNSSHLSLPKLKRKMLDISLSNLNK